MKFRGADGPEDELDEQLEQVEQVELDEQQNAPAKRRWGKVLGRTEETAEPVDSEELDWLADLRTAKEQRVSIGPGDAEEPEVAKPPRARRNNPDEPAPVPPPRQAAADAPVPPGRRRPADAAEPMKSRTAPEPLAPVPPTVRAGRPPADPDPDDEPVGGNGTTRRPYRPRRAVAPASPAEPAGSPPWASASGERRSFSPRRRTASEPPAVPALSAPADTDPARRRPPSEPRTGRHAVPPATPGRPGARSTDRPAFETQRSAADPAADPAGDADGRRWGAGRRAARTAEAMEDGTSVLPKFGAAAERRSFRSKETNASDEAPPSGDDSLNTGGARRGGRRRRAEAQADPMPGLTAPKPAGSRGGEARRSPDLAESKTAIIPAVRSPAEPDAGRASRGTTRGSRATALDVRRSAERSDEESSSPLAADSTRPTVGASPRATAAEPSPWRFNPPPGWPPCPPGWVPPEGWRPDPSWPTPPSGWQFWVLED